MTTHMRYCVDLAQHFWPKVQKRGPDECWLWGGRKDARGYGRYGKQGPNTYPHRVAWRLTNGEIPDGLEVAHRCDVRNCCNPSHLFLATHEENMADCANKARSTHGERNWNAILTADQVREIRAKYVKVNRRKTNIRQLAAEYGISMGAACSIVTGRTWKRV